MQTNRLFFQFFILSQHMDALPGDTLIHPYSCLLSLTLHAVLPLSRLTLWLSAIRQRCHTGALEAPELFIPTKSSPRRCRAKATHLARQLPSLDEYKTRGYGESCHLWGEHSTCSGERRSAKRERGTAKRWGGKTAAVTQSRNTWYCTLYAQGKRF